MTAHKLTAAELRALLPKMAFNELLGIRLSRLHKDGVTIVCSVRDDLRNGAGFLHGGVTATLADACAGIALTRHFGGKRPITTVELKVNYFRPVAAGKVFARAHLIRIGSTLCVARTDLKDEERNLIATGLVTYMLLGDRS